MTRRKLPVLSLAACLLLALAACEADVDDAADTAEESEEVGDDVTETDRDDRELVVLQPVDFTSYDPNTVPSGPSTNMQQQVVEPLIDRNGDPLLAESWEQVDDTDWELQLREGVSFHNGDPFDADAAAFSIERIMDPDSENTALQTEFTDAIESVESAGEHELLITTTRPYPDLPDVLRNAWMLPPDAVDDDFDTDGVGTGAYTASSWSPGEELVMERNPDYWGEEPFFERVVWRPVSEDTVRSTELRNGNADLITAVPVEELERIEVDGLEVTELPSTQSVRIHLDAAAEPFDDARVRQAMNYGTDREQILEQLLEGAGELLNSPSGPDIFGYDPELEPYPYDPERARQLLEEAGYPDGFEAEMQFPEGRFTRDRAIGEALTAQLAEIGISIDANYSEFGRWLEIFNVEGEGYMVMAQEDTVVALMRPNFHSSSESFKRYNYANDEVDALIEEAETTPDDAERETTYRELNEVLRDDAPWVYLWNPLELYGSVEGLSGFEPSGVGYFYVRDLARE